MSRLLMAWVVIEFREWGSSLADLSVILVFLVRFVIPR